LGNSEHVWSKSGIEIDAKFVEYFLRIGWSADEEELDFGGLGHDGLR
jgi:hypothetical protein